MSRPLQQRNTRSLLTWLPLVMLAGSVFLYLILMGHIRHMKHQQLQRKQDNVWNAFVLDTLHFPMKMPGEYLVTRGSPKENLTADSANQAWLTQLHRLDGNPYSVTTYIAAKEFRHLLIKVGIAEGIIFIVLLVAIVMVNRRTSSRLWAPFYVTMNNIRGYDIRQNKPLSLDTTTGTEEFDRLNHTLSSLIGNADQAYRNQKQFTENASHELQTPLAIIRSKVELLTEAPGLTEDSAQLLQEINDANERLSQMNKNLLLLARIENSQYPETGRVEVSGLLERLITFLEDYYTNEGIKTKATIEAGVDVTANPALIEILVNNLLRNAYIHNVPRGWVDVRLSGKGLVIKNSGPALEGDPKRLFDRFRKGRVDNRTTGLGLALVQQIAQLYSFDVRYAYEAGVHQLTLLFR